MWPQHPRSARRRIVVTRAPPGGSALFHTRQLERMRDVVEVPPGQLELRGVQCLLELGRTRHAGRHREDGRPRKRPRKPDSSSRVSVPQHHSPQRIVEPRRQLVRQRRSRENLDTTLGAVRQHLVGAVAVGQR